jgi:serine/threonine protein kinase
MEQSPEKRTKRFTDPGIGLQEDDRTVEMDRETLDDGPPRATNESAVHETEGTRKTEIYRNDYERALPAHYRLIRMIGRGGMSEVFLAEDKRLGRSVAIKFLNSEFRSDPDRMRRFNREARAASALNHPNILTIHDIGETEGVQFIVSEFVDGETLGSRISKGRLPLPEAVRIAMQIASALSASHNAGIVHRDIKPDNVMIRRDGSVKVLDFGLAKETGSILYDSNGAEAQTLETAPTSPGLILGTPQYMSPEQARGRALDARTDIFSFGVILFEMVTGKQPFPGTSMVDIIAAVIGNEPLPLAKFLDDPPELLVRIVEKALRKNKEERYGTMDHLLSDLRDVQREVADVPFTDRSTRGGNVRHTRPNTIRTFLGESPARRNLILLLVLGLPVLAVIGWWIAGSRSGSDQTIAASSMRMVPITNWSSGTGELVAAASFSPDARMVAFAATKTGATEIWVKPVVGGEPIQVTKNGFYNQYPVWSPNSQDIAFFSRKGTDPGIWRASFSGGEQIQIAKGISGLARPVLWSASSKIYFQDGSELFAVEEKTGAVVRVTDLESNGMKPRTIQLSDDEKQIAFSVKEENGWKVKVSDLSGGDLKEVYSSPEQIDLLAWEPAGKAVIFSASANGGYQIYRSLIGVKDPQLLSNGNLDFFVQDVSSGGDILYGSATENSDLWKVGIPDAGQSIIANDVATEFWPDVSPDGKNIAYQSVNQADRPYRGSIRLRKLESPADPLTLSPEGFAPVWSPDGRYIAYFRRSDAGISVWRVNADGSSALKLADGGISPPGYFATPYLKRGAGHLSWSPDGSSLAYSARTDGISNIQLVASDGSKNAQLTTNTNPAESFCCSVWAPDGSALIVNSEYSEPGAPQKRGYRLWNIPVAGGESRVLFESTALFRFLGRNGDEFLIAERVDPNEITAIAKNLRIIAINSNTRSSRDVMMLKDAYFQNIHLAPDARTLAYVTRAQDMSAVWLIPIKGGQGRKLLEENDPKILISTLTWSPDGGSIVFGKQTRTNLISMLSN